MMIPLAGGWLGDTDYDSWKLMSPDEEHERTFGPSTEDDPDEPEDIFGESLFDDEVVGLGTKTEGIEWFSPETP